MRKAGQPQGMSEEDLEDDLLEAFDTLSGGGEGLVGFVPLEPGDLGELQGVCKIAGAHNPSYQKRPAPGSPPKWATGLRKKLRSLYGRKAVGKILCHVAECDGCRARAFRYGVTVRLKAQELVLEREFGETPEKPTVETSET